MDSEHMPLDRMSRLLRAKQHELEHAVLNNAVLNVHDLAGDIALVYAILADYVEQEAGRSAP